jgi:IS605 OrfB family transposase
VIRSVPVSLNLATATKKRALQALIGEVRSSINFFCNSIWINPGRLDSETLNRFSGGSLSYRHRSNALKVALETVSITKKNAREFGIKPSCPVSKNAITLSSLVCKVEPGKNSFDYVIKISGFKSGEPITIPFRSHKRLNYWLAKPGASFKQGAIIDLPKNRAILWVNIPQEEGTQSGRTLGVDIGKLKMLATSAGEFLGTEFKKVCDNVRRKKPGSKAKRRARTTRECYINKTCKQLPWSSIGTLKIENLKNMKRGKKRGRGKKFRKAMAPWTYREVSTRLTQLAQENRVCLELINPKNTSRTCPQCGLVAKENRVGEMFKCVRCNYTADADFVGALNISLAPPENSRQRIVAGSRKS